LLNPYVRLVEDKIDKKLRSGTIKVHVVFVPMSSEEPWARVDREPTDDASYLAATSLRGRQRPFLGPWSAPCSFDQLPAGRAHVHVREGSRTLSEAVLEGIVT
jgi:hypothetical protein